MKFQKTSYYNRTTYTYRSVTGETITLAPGASNGQVTPTLIRLLHSFDDKEVYNNIKNHKTACPGQEAPQKWSLSLDAFSEDPDSDMDRSDLMREIYDKLHAEDRVAARLGDVIDEMSYKQRQAFVLVELDGYSMTEAADKLGCSIANVSKLIARAKEYIKNNY